MANVGTVDLAVNGPLARLTLNRPEKLNALTHAMSRQLFDHVDVINRDHDIRVVVIGGQGRRAFSAGSDLSSLDQYGTNWELRNRAVFRNDYIDALLTIRKPIVAAIDGVAYGGGLEIACIADIRIATPESSFSAAEIRWGWHAGSGQTQYLPRLIGYGNALRLLLTGDAIDAAEAHAMGLVQVVVSHDGFETAVNDMAMRIASNAPIAVQLARHIVRQGMNLPLSSALAWENDLFAYLMTTRDAREGQDAFAQKRSPKFVGE